METENEILLQKARAQAEALRFSSFPEAVLALHIPVRIETMGKKAATLIDASAAVSACLAVTLFSWVVTLCVVRLNPERWKLLLVMTQV